MPCDANVIDDVIVLISACNVLDVSIVCTYSPYAMHHTLTAIIKTLDTQNMINVPMVMA